MTDPPGAPGGAARRRRHPDGARAAHSRSGRDAALAARQRYPASTPDQHRLANPRDRLPGARARRPGGRDRGGLHPGGGRAALPRTAAARAVPPAPQRRAGRPVRRSRCRGRARRSRAGRRLPRARRLRPARRGLPASDGRVGVARPPARPLVAGGGWPVTRHRGLRRPARVRLRADGAHLRQALGRLLRDGPRRPRLHRRRGAGGGDDPENDAGGARAVGAPCVLVRTGKLGARRADGGRTAATVIDSIAGLPALLEARPRPA